VSIDLSSDEVEDHTHPINGSTHRSTNHHQPREPITGETDC
jgi:hypothetical protein